MAPARAISMPRSKRGTATKGSSLRRRRPARRRGRPSSKVCGAPLRGRQPRGTSTSSSRWKPSIGRSAAAPWATALARPTAVSARVDLPEPGAPAMARMRRWPGAVERASASIRWKNAARSMRSVTAGPGVRSGRVGSPPGIQTVGQRGCPTPPQARRAAPGLGGAPVLRCRSALYGDVPHDLVRRATVRRRPPMGKGVAIVARTGGATMATARLGQPGQAPGAGGALRLPRPSRACPGISMDRAVRAGRGPGSGAGARGVFFFQPSGQRGGPRPPLGGRGCSAVGLRFMVTPRTTSFVARR